MKQLTTPEAAGLSDSSSPHRKRWLNCNVFGMGLTSLLSDVGHESATAVLPAFLSAIGASPVALGVIEGVADAVASFVKLGAGWYSDRVGHRKPVAVAGYFLTGIAKALFAFAWSWPLVLVGRVIGWLGRGIRGPLRDAILAESVSPEDIGKAFGFHRAGDTLGAILGPLLAVLVIGHLELAPLTDPSQPFRVVFLLTLIPGVGSALAFALMVKEQRRPANHELHFWANLRALPQSYKRFLIGVGISGLGDLVDYGPQPQEAIQWVRERAIKVVRGNHDHALAYHVDCHCAPVMKEASITTRAWRTQLLTAEEKTYLRGLPLSERVELSGATFFLAHASPAGDLYKYLRPEISDEALAEEIRGIDADFVCIGHTHLPMLRRIGTTTIINPGMATHSPAM